MKWRTEDMIMKKLMKLLLLGFFIATAGLVEAAQPLVNSAWVEGNIGKPGVVFLDVRGRLAGKSKADYLRAHIPGAVYTNYLKDGWRVKDRNGTVGMLPSVAKLEKLIGGLGIGNDDHVVIIPNGGTALDMGTATRIYWTFKVIGDDNVSILDGGMLAYTRALNKKTGKPLNPLDRGLVKPVAKRFKGSIRKEMIATEDDVKSVLGGNIPLVDNRPNDQFVGVNRHSKAKRNGTIPGARNLPESWLTRNGGGQFRSRAELVKLYAAAGVPISSDQISFCNTGHWASLGWFASSEILGNKQARMYDGSMVEWSADSRLPMEKKVK